MSLMEVLGYEVAPQAGWRRSFVELAAREPLSSMIARTATPLDRLAVQVSAGRWTATSFMTGFPVLWLTTTGARSQQPRTVPLLGIPTPDGNLAVLGTNFGGDTTPAWVSNVTAHPDVVAEWRGNSTRARAITVPESHQAPIWERAIAAYPNYANYRTKAAHRDITVFELSPEGDT